MSSCSKPCPLSKLPSGIRAVVVRIACSSHDANRLRVLGMFEGTPITIVDDRVGVVLDVRGARLAISASIAAAIIGLPLVSS